VYSGQLCSRTHIFCNAVYAVLDTVVSSFVYMTVVRDINIGTKYEKAVMDCSFVQIYDFNCITYCI
jgi:hypothetical protein